ncbi:MAG: hypothetical protein ACYDC6_02970 [Acidobacteriaceae bacterium]
MVLLLTPIWLPVGYAQERTCPNLGPADPCGEAWRLAASDPAALMEIASRNELANAYGHHSPLRYRVRKIGAKTDTTKEIVETRDGGVARLIAIRGHALNPVQQNAEIERLHALAIDPAIEAHRRRHEERDAVRAGKIIRLLPHAFLYAYAGPAQSASSVAIRLTFTPNPKFSPPDLEARVLTGVRGEVWIDPVQRRIIRVRGKLFRAVDFGWGLLGVLDPGGSIEIEQSDIPAVGWQLSQLTLNLRGTAVLIKHLRLSVTETVSDYHRVPSDWQYRDAVRWLLAQQFPPVRILRQSRRLSVAGPSKGPDRNR